MSDDLQDLAAGVKASALAEGGKLVGRVGDDEVLLVRAGGEVFAVGAHCTHYHGPLGEGFVVGTAIRCPWHHAAFDLRTGHPDRPPALNPLPCWKVEEKDGVIRVLGRAEPKLAPAAKVSRPESVVIIGSGAAGSKAAETLRELGYDGAVSLVDPDPGAPYDRPNVSKDYLAGTAPEEWMPLRDAAFYAAQRITRHEGLRARAIDLAARTVTLDDGSALPYGALLLATGAEPVRLPLDDPDGLVRTLRSLEDSRALIAAAARTKRVVIIGASFVGLEVAASLRARGVEVDVVAPEAVPFERVLGRELGAFIRSVHEEKGVRFHLGRTVRSVRAGAVVLDDGAMVEAGLVVMAVGVRPRTQLAEAAGLEVDRAILVDEHLRTSDPHVFAAGDAVSWRDRRSGRRLHVEHWVVAQRQGQVAAHNILGRSEPFDAIPFFWSQHHDVVIAYVGHAEQWDEATVNGVIADRDCTVTYREKGEVRAVATIFRDDESLRAEVAFERQMAT